MASFLTAGRVVHALIALYFAVLAKHLHVLFFPAPCPEDAPRSSCVEPTIGANETYDLYVYASPHSTWKSKAFMRDVHAPRVVDAEGNVARVAANEEEDGDGEGEGGGSGAGAEDEDGGDPVAILVGKRLGARVEDAVRVNVTLPAKAFGTRANGTMYAHVMMYPDQGRTFARKRKKGESDADFAVAEAARERENERKRRRRAPTGGPLSVATASLTKHLVYDRADGAMLLGGGGGGGGGAKTEESKSTTNPTPRTPTTHLRPRLTIFTLKSPRAFPVDQIPGDMNLEFTQSPQYRGYAAAYRQPMQVDDVTIPRREYVPLDANASRADPTMTVTMHPCRVGVYRLWRQVAAATETMITSFGMTRGDVDEVIEMFTATDWKYMMMMFLVSALHSWFAFLAFKSDVGFWKQKSNLEGLSVRSQWSSFVCTLIIFLNLADTGQASTIILVEMGVGVAIEAWKVSKFLARDGTLHRLFGVGDPPAPKTQMQKDVESYDKRAMFVLSLTLYPVVAAYGAYSLLNHPQRSWRSWALRTLANGVYMFGFIAMTPQLYVNYRLKSVAHLPWKAFTYKAFNTFIDDVFAFAIAMPTIHRLACLRDDVVFFVYLYQRWLYPVDKKRVNEFGRAYEKDENDEEKKEEDEEKKDEEGDVAETKKDK
jgi:hypothetical protein